MFWFIFIILLKSYVVVNIIVDFSKSKVEYSRRELNTPSLPGQKVACLPLYTTAIQCVLRSYVSQSSASLACGWLPEP